MAHQLPALLGCLVFGYGLCWYCWLCLVFGLRISWYLFSGMDRFLMIWWGRVDFSIWLPWHLGEMSEGMSYFNLKCEKFGIYKEAPMTQQQLQVDVVFVPSFLAFMFKGVKLHVKTCVLLKGRKAERCLSRFLCWNFEDFQKQPTSLERVEFEVIDF